MDKQCPVGARVMPLRGHFRSPSDDVHSWDELHGMWPAMMVRQLVEILLEPYVAEQGSTGAPRHVRLQSHRSAKIPMPINVDSEIRILSEDEFHTVAHQVMGIVFDVHNEYGRLVDEEIYKQQSVAGVRRRGSFPLAVRWRSRSCFGTSKSRISWTCCSPRASWLRPKRSTL